MATTTTTTTITTNQASDMITTSRVSDTNVTDVNDTDNNINATIALEDNTTTTTPLPSTMFSSTTSLPIQSLATTMAPTTTTTVTTTTTLAMPTTTLATTWLGLSMSHTVLIAVFTGCTALILLVLCVICCRLLCTKSKRDSPEGGRVKQQSTRNHSGNHYADPYRIVENHYHSNDVTKLYATPELTYAKPEIYSTFINPSFYEDVYARWKLQEQSRFDRSYDSPMQYSRRLKDQMETPEFKWSVNSLRAVDNYDYDKYGRIPRGKLSSESEKDDAETVTTEPAAFTTF